MDQRCVLPGLLGDFPRILAAVRLAVRDEQYAGQGLAAMRGERLTQGISDGGARPLRTELLNRRGLIGENRLAVETVNGNIARPSASSFETISSEFRARSSRLDSRSGFDIGLATGSQHV